MQFLFYLISVFFKQNKIVYYIYLCRKWSIIDKYKIILNIEIIKLIDRNKNLNILNGFYIKVYILNFYFIKILV